MKNFYSILAVLTALSLTSYASIAFDTSSNAEYDGGWNGGENGGEGFGQWTIVGSGGGSYIDSSTRGSKGFRQFSESWGQNSATRMFDSALSAGDSFIIELGHSGGNDGEVGISLLSGASTKFNVKLVAGAAYWQAWDGGNYDLNGDPPGARGDGIADYFTTDDWGGDASTLQFTYNGGQSYGLYLFNGDGNGFSFDAHDAGHDISGINGVVVYSNNQGGGKNFWVDNLAVIPEPATIGLLGFVGSSLVWFRKRFSA